MVFEGRVSYNEDPMTVSVRGMIQQMDLLNCYTDNIAYSQIPGYQRKAPVVTSFAEQLGYRGVDKVTDTSSGQIHMTTHPLDFAVNNGGYFQKLHQDGQVELTRDGRFKLDDKGHLLSEDNMPILSRDGTPIVLPFVPNKLSQIKVDPDGAINIVSLVNSEIRPAGQLGIAKQDGSPMIRPEIRQGYVEESNVFLHEEFVGMIIPRRNMSADRQMFLTHSQLLSRLIQEMGRTQ